MTWLYIFLIIYTVVHILICILIYLGIRAEILKISGQLVPIILLVPVVGVITAFVAEYNSRMKKSGTKDITLEDPHLEFADLRLQNVERDDNEGEVIPLQEALLVNDSQTRRKLMLDILRQNPKEYVSLLQEACSDGDLEVSHYASTAIMEIQREYEISMQKAEREYIADPEDKNKLKNCIRCTERYIDSGLIDKSIIPVYRRKFAEFLSKKIEISPEDMNSHIKAIDNYIFLENYTEAEILTDKITSKWVKREAVWLSKLKLCYSLCDSRGIKETLEMIEKNNVYLSPEGKEIFMFWKNSVTEVV